MKPILFLKSHVGPYLRGGKVVNVAGYNGRAGRSAAAAGQLSLFFPPSAPMPPNRFKGVDPVRATPDLFADAPVSAIQPRTVSIGGTAYTFPDAAHEQLYRYGRSLLEGREPSPDERARLWSVFGGFVEHMPDDDAPFASAADVDRLALDYADNDSIDPRNALSVVDPELAGDFARHLDRHAGLVRPR